VSTAGSGQEMGVRPARSGVSPAMVENFRKGDKVSWQSHGSTAEGEVVEKITADTEAAGRTVRASPEDPQYRVRSDKSGADAVHKPSALTRRQG
jgi:Hypervirulence associated proteins TUDOR domain